MKVVIDEALKRGEEEDTSLHSRIRQCLEVLVEERRLAIDERPSAGGIGLHLAAVGRAVEGSRVTRHVGHCNFCDAVLPNVARVEEESTLVSEEADVKRSAWLGGTGRHPNQDTAR